MRTGVVLLFVRCDMSGIWLTLAGRRFSMPSSSVSPLITTSSCLFCWIYGDSNQEEIVTPCGTKSGITTQ